MALGEPSDYRGKKLVEYIGIIRRGPTEGIAAQAYLGVKIVVDYPLDCDFEGPEIRGVPVAHFIGLIRQAQERAAFAWIP